jgi:hypothetical protein
MFLLHKSRDIHSQLTQRLLFKVFPGPGSLENLHYMGVLLHRTELNTEGKRAQPFDVFQDTFIYCYISGDLFQAFRMG